MFRDHQIEVEIAKGVCETRTKPGKFRRFGESSTRVKIDLVKRAGLQYSLLMVVLLSTLLFLAIHLILRPIIRVRIGLLVCDRIGHLAVYTELYLRRKASRTEKGREFVLFFSGTPANHQLLKMIKRRIRVINHPILPQLYWAVKSITGRFGMCLDLHFYGDEFEEFNNISPQLAFTQEEENRGRMLLQSMGIEPGAPFVCIFARDPAYMNRFHSAQNSEGWTRHNHRNSDILNCLLAAEYLASQGIYTIRMGQVVEKALPESNPKIIDYATNHRTDFGDVYLGAKCQFFLGCNSGAITISQIFGVPIAWANLIPLWHMPWVTQDIFIPKELRRIESNAILEFSEILSSGMYKWYRSQWYEEAGIQVVENSPEQILALTKEMQARIDGTWESTDEDEELQRQFKELFHADHLSYGFPSRIGADFLRHQLGLIS